MKISERGWVKTNKREKDKAERRKRLMCLCRGEWRGGWCRVGRGVSGCKPRTLCLSKNKISHPDSTAIVFPTDRGKQAVERRYWIGFSAKCLFSQVNKQASRFK